jgi:hypothetical protein
MYMIDTLASIQLGQPALGLTQEHQALDGIL